MRNPIRNAVVIVGIILLGWLMVVLMRSGDSSRNGNEGEAREPVGKPGLVTTVAGKSGEDVNLSGEGEVAGRTKSKERPVETAADRLRKTRTRLLDEMEVLKRAGLAGRHPNVVTVTRELQKVEAELVAAGEVVTPAE